MRRRAVLGGLAALAPLAARAQPAGARAEALSGARFVSNGQEFLLADVLAPPLYLLSDEKPPHFETSRLALSGLLLQIADISDAMAPTRWGVRRVHAAGADGERLQAGLVAAGAVRVAPESDDLAFITRLLELEAQARAARRGLWALPAYRVFNAANTWGAIGGFHLIEGTVSGAGKFGARCYLNFGEDYRTDFTAGAASRLYGSWLKAGTDFGALAGAEIRIRGYVEAINGPSVGLKVPLQVETIG